MPLLISVWLVWTGFSFISTYHRFHFAPVICLQMWKHNWVAPWPTCHAGEESRRMMNISCPLFLLFNIRTSCTTRDPSSQKKILYVCVRLRERSWQWPWLTVLPWNDSSPMFSSFLLSACSGCCGTWLLSHTQQWVVLLCRLATVPLLW